VNTKDSADILMKSAGFFTLYNIASLLIIEMR